MPRWDIALKNDTCEAILPTLALCRNGNATCTVSNVEKWSRANCTPGEQFGCHPRSSDGSQVWTKDGCRGKFECGERRGTFSCYKGPCACGSFASPLNTTLVASIGSVRGGPLAHESLLRHVLAPLSADLAVLCSYEVQWDEPLLRAAKHVWRVPEYADWELLVNETNHPLHHNWRTRVRLTPNLWGPLRDMPGSGAIIFSLRLVLLRYLDSLVGHVYTTLIVTRTDLVYACDHPPLRPTLGEMYVQEGQGEDVHGEAIKGKDQNLLGKPVSDRHSILHFDDRHRALEVLPWLTRNHPDTLYAPEIILGWYYAQKQLAVRLFPRVNFAVRRPAFDATRWNWGGYGSARCGNRTAGGWIYVAKYEAEHNLAVGTCSHDPCLTVH